MNEELLKPLRQLIRESKLNGVNDSTIIEAERVLVNLNLCRIIDLSPEIEILLTYLLDKEFNEGRSHEALALQALDECQLDKEKLVELTLLHEEENYIDTDSEEDQEPNITNYKDHL